MNPEGLARQNIDALLEAEDWVICDADKANIFAARGMETQSSKYVEGLPEGLPSWNS